MATRKHQGELRVSGSQQRELLCWGSRGFGSCTARMLAVAFILLLSSCGSNEEEAAEVSLTAVPASEVPEKLTAGQPLQWTPEPESPVFVEVVYEVSARPLKGVRVHSADRPDQLNGFILEEMAAGRILHPAMGVEPNQSVPRFWVGYRLVDRTPHDIHHFQWLGASHESHLDLATGELPSRAEYSGLFAVLRQPVELQIVKGKDGEVTVNVGEEISTLVPGTWSELFVAEQSYTPDELFMAMEKALEIDGHAPLDVEGLKASIRIQFPHGDARVLYLKISALLYSDVKVSTSDALFEWQRAIRLSRDGPYPEALLAVEKVLLAVPSYRHAIERWAKLQDLIASGAEASFIEGRIVYPSGAPDDKLRALWQKYHAGIVALSTPEGTEDVAVATAPVEEGRFRIAVPSGSYRLSVAVPGFDAVEQLVNVKGRTEIDVPLARR